MWELKRQVKWQDLQVLLHVMSNSTFICCIIQKCITQKWATIFSPVTLRQHSSWSVYILVKLEVKNIPLSLCGSLSSNGETLAHPPHIDQPSSPRTFDTERVTCVGLFKIDVFLWDGEGSTCLSSLVGKSFSRPSRWKSLGSSCF